MGIFQKFSMLIRSNINEAIARAENPEKMLNQVLIDMREQLAKAKQEVAVAIADERKLKSQMEEETKLANDWEHRAMLAVGENRDDLAKQALLRQEEHAERANNLNETWQKQAFETEKLKDSLRQLNDKIEEAKRKRNLLVAKAKRAQAQLRIHQTMAGLNDRSAFEVFDRMAGKIEENERMAVATAEVHEALNEGDTLEQEFKKLKPADQSVEFRLLALKEKMNLQNSRALPGGAAASNNNAGGPRRIGAGDGGVKDVEIDRS